jgi:hypothetical protein
VPALVWLNPLLRYADFEARPAGIRAMLPWVDDFLPVHNLASLESLARTLTKSGSSGDRPSPGRRYLEALGRRAGRGAGSPGPGARTGRTRRGRGRPSRRARGRPRALVGAAQRQRRAALGGLLREGDEVGERQRGADDDAGA